tara:strand:+ start:70 stop:618 length:549 start_codon:yes stop_codon:yes gene_type:complete
MSGFHTKTFIKHDDYATPFYAWDNIKQYIPKDKIIWEAFYLDGASGTHLQKLGFKVINEEIDFFKHDKGEIVVSNPPFTKCPAVLARLVELDKPFILIMPSSKINTQYFRKIFANQDNPIQIIIPRRRINFTKKVDGKTVEQGNRCNFDCLYYCWKMNLPRDIIWLGDDCMSRKDVDGKEKK